MIGRYTATQMDDDSESYAVEVANFKDFSKTFVLETDLICTKTEGETIIKITRNSDDMKTLTASETDTIQLTVPAPEICQSEGANLCVISPPQQNNGTHKIPTQITKVKSNTNSMAIAVQVPSEMIIGRGDALFTVLTTTVKNSLQTESLPLTNKKQTEVDKYDRAIAINKEYDIETRRITPRKDND